MAVDEKKAFAERLKLALSRLPKSVKTAADVAHNFNLKHPNEPITPQAATKWLNGTAIPKSDKIETLAEWLHVTPYWLKHGSPPPSSRKPVAGKRVQPIHTNQLNEKEARLLAKLRSLSEYQAYIVAELIDQLALEREIWVDPER